MEKTQNRILFTVIFFLICVNGIAADKVEQQKPPEIKEFYVYQDKDAAVNHYYPSEYIADAQDLEFDDNYKENVQSGITCIQVKYKASGSFGWAGIYWVNPKGNWGEQKGGYDLRFAKKLTFWARGEKGGEYIAVFKFGGIKGFYPDSDNHGIGPLVLTKEWKQYTVDVSKRNMSSISAGFSFAITKAHNRQGCIFYIDNIKYE